MICHNVPYNLFETIYGTISYFNLSDHLILMDDMIWKIVRYVSLLKQNS